MKLIRRLLILSHRYLGIALSLMVVMWFATGIVMLYAGGMPRLSPETRLDRLPELDLSAVRLTAAQAAERAEIQDAPSKVVLLQVMGRPAYRFGARQPLTVFADTGEVLDEATLAQARTIARRFAHVPEDRVRHLLTLDERVDQWTLLQGRQLPLHKFAVDDGRATELYVSPQLAEVVVETTSRTRALAWISTIPHWLYFEGLRANQLVWYRAVVWTSALVCLLAVLGLLLGVTQYRRSRATVREAIPYAGWMRWHYITGVVFGVFTLTWAFSGMLSMEPFAWTNAEGLEVDREVFTGGPLELAAFPAIEPAAWRDVLDGGGLKELELTRIQDRHYYIVRQSADVALAAQRRERLHQPYNVAGRAESGRLIVAADTLQVRNEPFSPASLVGRLRTSLPDVPVVEQTLLTSYDSYYYSRGGQTPLPVLRVKFGDPAATWLYIDPEVSQVLAQVHRLNRVERWLYNGLHSFDFGFWYTTPLWDIGMIALLLGGLASSGIGLALGIGRMRRGAARTARAVAGAGTVAAPEQRPSES